MDDHEPLDKRINHLRTITNKTRTKERVTCNLHDSFENVENDANSALQAQASDKVDQKNQIIGATHQSRVAAKQINDKRKFKKARSTVKKGKPNKDITTVIKKLNKEIIREDGTVESFDKQLINLMSGVYDTKYPMIVSTDSKCLKYIDNIDNSLSLVINVSTVIKIREKHEIGYAFVSQCYDMLNDAVFAFDSLNNNSSKIVVLNKIDKDNGHPLIAIIKPNKQIGRNGTYVNEITSIYDKRAFVEYIVKAYSLNKTFYKNKKIELARSIRHQLSKDVELALSNNYNRSKFNRSQYKKDFIAMKYQNKNESFNSKIAKAEKKKRRYNQQKKKDVKTKCVEGSEKVA